jgi:hypothetical protein
MIKFVKIFWIVSLLSFVAALLFAYSYLPLQVVISQDERGIAEYIVEREQFFYSALIGCVFFNGMLLLLGALLLGLPGGSIPVPKRSIWTKNHVTRAELKVRLKNWLKGFGLAFNMYAMVVIGTIYDVNDNDIQFSFSALNTLIAFFVVIWGGFFFWLFNDTKSLEEELH